jgi:hypothetical protein
VELELPNAKGIRPAEAGSRLASRPSPPLTVAALNLRLHTDAKSQAQEILAASVVHMAGEGGRRSTEEERRGRRRRRKRGASGGGSGAHRPGANLVTR